MNDKEMFEKHIKEVLGLCVDIGVDGEYESDRTRENWLTWQAATAKSSTQLERMNELDFYKTMSVKIRRDIGKKVKTEAEQIDGKTYMFITGWLMGEDDPCPNEYAMIPRDNTYPIDAPPWIASGDLVLEDTP